MISQDLVLPPPMLAPDVALKILNDPNSSLEMLARALEWLLTKPRSTIETVIIRIVSGPNMSSNMMKALRLRLVYEDLITKTTDVNANGKSTNLYNRNGGLIEILAARNKKDIDALVGLPPNPPVQFSIVDPKLTGLLKNPGIGIGHVKAILEGPSYPKIKQWVLTNCHLPQETKAELAVQYGLKIEDKYDLGGLTLMPRMPTTWLNP